MGEGKRIPRRARRKGEEKRDLTSKGAKISITRKRLSLGERERKSNERDEKL